MSDVIADKNKSVSKLKNIGPIYYLNLDGQPERKEYMEDQFEYWEIEKYLFNNLECSLVPFQLYRLFLQE